MTQATFPEYVEHEESSPTEGLSFKVSSPCELVDALRRVRNLEGLSEDEYLWLARNSSERHEADGKELFTPEQPVYQMTILLAGEIQVRRKNNGPVAFFIGRSGQLTGKLPFSRMVTYGGYGTAVGDLWALDIHQDRYPAMLEAIPSMAQRCVSILLDRVREVTRMEQQYEKLNALGKLAANLSHELNNPASAARSAANNLWTELRNYGDTKYRLGSLCMSDETKAKYMEWVQSVRFLVSDDDRPHRADPLSINQREDQITAWMDANSLPDAWKIAPILAETQISVEHLNSLQEALPPEAVSVALSSFSSALKAERMTDAVMDATKRIFDLISAIKDYSYMDQAPIQEVDVPQSLENTLAMFTSRLNGVTVHRDFAADTPKILAYGSELNQVWTALIENALDAMEQCEHSDAVLTLRTINAHPSILVEIIDNGPGIDPGIMSRIFEPFFTTKPFGNAQGLGLDAANRTVIKHRGAIAVESIPGRTCFQVRLPVEQTGAY